MCSHVCALLTESSTMISPVQFEDGSRDVLNFLLHYLPERPSTASETCLPEILDPVEAEDSERRRSQGFQYRNLVGIGQCMGSTIL